MQEVNETNWKPVTIDDLTLELVKELDANHPRIEIIRQRLFEIFKEQSGISAAEFADATLHERSQFGTWIRFQEMNSQLSLTLRRMPRLQHLLFSDYASKATGLAQRHCNICHGMRPIEDHFPNYVFTIRINPISHQAASQKPQLLKAFKKAVEYRLKNSQVDISSYRYFCAALTFIVNDRASGQRDLDNMAKALQDALALALKFNDKYVHHLDVIKLMFPNMDEHVRVRLAPSFLNEHDEVIEHNFRIDWAGSQSIDIADFMDQ